MTSGKKKVKKQLRDQDKLLFCLLTVNTNDRGIWHLHVHTEKKEEE
jgi:hypothetical protein